MRPNARAIRALLNEENADFKVTVVEEADSTNLEAGRRFVRGKRQLIVAVRQTAGRGRIGRSFHSPEGGLYMTVLIPFTRLPVTVAAGVAVGRAVEERTGKITGLKWVNDVYVADKKVCGILAESVYPRYIAVGIGINLSTECFPANLERAGGIGETDINALAAAVVNQFTAVLPREDLMELYRAKCFTVGREVVYTLNGAQHTARALGIDEGGGLILDNGEVLTTGGLSN